MFTAHPSSPRRKARIVASVGALAVAVTMLSACTSPDPNATAKAVDFELTAQTAQPSGDLDSFTWSLSAEPTSLAYTYAFDYPPNQILANVCESLLRWNPDLSVSPGLATAFSNPTPTTWVYDIREGVTFHDGTALTAADVVASLKRNLDPEVGSYWASAYQNVASIDQTGPMQVTVTTTVPDSQFNSYMAATPGVVESAATLAKDGADYGNPTTGVNCTGPFSFGSWSPGSSITLERYDGYWDADLAAHSKEVKFVFLGDPSARVTAFQSGDVDGGWQVPTSGIEQLKASGAGGVYFGVNTAVSSEIVSDLNGPLGDKNVRQALLMATDRKGLISAAENGYASLTDAFTTPTVWTDAGADAKAKAFDDLKTYGYDVAAAKKLVTDAGVSGQKIVIAMSPASVAESIIAQAVSSAATAIGLVPEIKTISPDKYGALFVDPAAREGIDLFFTNFYNSTSDPLDTLAVLQSDNFSNYGGWSNSEYDAAFATATSELDPIARGTSEAQMQVIANEELPWLPLYSSPTTVWLNKRITGVAPSIAFLYYPWAAMIGAA
ncbi:ABC transporter substrate-binding protein [uncultured Microbacterium sp.]|uniref:ABC transporter substrate-binding protein n=1 Tax=uncultured Microbacterium sp. TaxID=191216 RepID=UPI0035CBC21A